MPRNYVRKRHASYSDASLMLALKAIAEGKTIYAASMEYDIPYPTLRRWSLKKPNHRGQGRKPWLTKQEEKCIVDCLKFLDKCRLPFDRSDVSYIIETYFKFSNTRTSPFGNKPPGNDFIRNFERRWSEELTERKPEILTKNRPKRLTKEIVDVFFKNYSAIIDENGLQGHPERIFNLDEVGLGSDLNQTSVFVPKKSRYSYLMSPTCKTMFSVLFCISASGNHLPPFTIYKGADLRETWTKNGPSGGLYTVTESGMMQESILESWMKHFVNHTKDMKKPIILIYDGLGCQMTYGTIVTARDNGIIIICLPSHTSHALQPLDVGVFPSLKETWKEIVKEWFLENKSQNISEEVFPGLLKRLTGKFSPKDVVKGFQCSGLYPLNKTEVERRLVVQIFHNKPSTSRRKKVKSTSSILKAGNEGSADLKVVSSPLKELNYAAILCTLSSPALNDANRAIKNLNVKREREEATTDEVQTADLDESHIHEQRRIKKACHSPKTRILKKPSIADQKEMEEKVKNRNTITPFIVTLKQEVQEEKLL